MSPEIPISPPIRTACLRASVPDRISITSSSSRTAAAQDGSQALAAASMVMAICSFLFMLNMGSLFFGSLGVIFALLSRGAGRMSGTAKAGLAGCTIGIIVGICMYAFLLFNMVSGGSTNLLERYYNQYMQEYQMTPDSGTTTDGNTI